MRAGRWRDQLRCNRKNLEIGERLASLELQARANLNLGVNLASLGETAESIAASRRALALYDRMCVPASAGLARNNLAIALVDAGELDEAERQVAEAQRLSQLFGGLYYATRPSSPGRGSRAGAAIWPRRGRTPSVGDAGRRLADRRRHRQAHAGGAAVDGRRPRGRAPQAR
jgi:tetratricopeptide (TPR) repeat protein